MATPDLSITIAGVPQLVARLGRTVALATLRGPMQRSLERLRRDLASYPPPPQGSTYKRTGDLGRSWKTSIQTDSAGLVGTVGNAVRSRKSNRAYAPYVQRGTSQPKPHQAWMHVGRWETDEQVIGREKAAIEQDFGTTIGRALS